MLRSIALCALSLCTVSAFAAQDVATAVVGSVKSVDKVAKVVIVDTKDGAEHTFHYTEKLAVHTGDDAGKAGKDMLHGIDKGTRVAVRYTAKGSRETAHEIDRLGDGGLKVAKGTIKDVDHGTRTIAIDTGKGAVETATVSASAPQIAAVPATEGAIAPLPGVRPAALPLAVANADQARGGRIISSAKPVAASLGLAD